MKNRIKNATKKGFSLVELLVVVAIIGVLAGVGIVAYNNYIDDAETKVVEANAKLLAKKISAERAKERTKSVQTIVQDAVTEILAGGAKNITSASGTIPTKSNATPPVITGCDAATTGVVHVVYSTTAAAVCYNDGTKTDFVKAF